jgi:hypothetical protein
MDQIVIVVVCAAVLYERHILAPQSLSARILNFIEEFGSSATTADATNGKEVLFVRIRK